MVVLRELQDLNKSLSLHVYRDIVLQFRGCCVNELKNLFGSQSFLRTTMTTKMVSPSFFKLRIAWFAYQKNSRAN